MDGDWPRQIQAAASRLDLPLDADQVDRLARYLRLLSKWNKAFNLTAVRDEDDWVSRHLVDSLAVLRWLCGKRVLDVGSGAGLPGVPLAVARPQMAFVLLDANGKKTRFLRQVVLQLPLHNVKIVQARVEAFEDPHGFDSLVSRAFSSLAQYWASARHLLASGGVMLAMKGKQHDDELEELLQLESPPAVEIQRLETGEKAQRHLYMLRET